MLEAFPFLEQKFFDNTGLDYVIALGIFVLAYGLLWLIKNVVLKRISSLKFLADRGHAAFVIELFRSVNQFILGVIAFYAATHKLNMAPAFRHGVSNAVFIIVAFQMILLASRIVIYVIQQYHFGGSRDEMALRSTKRNLSAIATTVVWITGILFILSNLGININSFVTGLGIGGIAIALAAQSVLGDVFSSFTIAIDKPFEIGDFIIVGENKGTVELIGLKTTRIRSLSGELLVMSNSDLTGSRIQNFKRMYDRRVNFKIGVTYETPLEKLKEIPILIRKIVEENDGISVDRVHVLEFAESSINVDVVYFVKSSDYNIYCDIQQKINFRICEEFAKRSISMAYPTRTVHLVGEGRASRSPSS